MFQTHYILMEGHTPGKRTWRLFLVSVGILGALMLCLKAFEPTSAFATLDLEVNETAPPDSHAIPTTSWSSVVCSKLSGMRSAGCVRSLLVAGGMGALTGPILVPIYFGGLALLGFGAAGVAAGSCAAACMMPLTAAGSCFAVSQSAGALGCWSAAWPVALVLSLIGLGLGLSVVWSCGDCSISNTPMR